MKTGRERFFCPDCGQLKLACTCQPMTRVEPVRYVRVQHPDGATQWVAQGGELYNGLIRSGWVEKMVMGDE